MKKLFINPLSIILAAALTLTSCVQQNTDPDETVSESLTISESVSETTAHTYPNETVSEKQTEASKGADTTTVSKSLTAETSLSSQEPVNTAKETTVTEAEMKNTGSTENANTTAIKEITFIEETSPESEIATSATTSQVVSSLKARQLQPMRGRDCHIHRK